MSMPFGWPNNRFVKHIPPVDLHWFFGISIRTEKKIQQELKKKFSYFILKFFFSYKLELKNLQFVFREDMW